jgi:hypothetical protein
MRRLRPIILASLVVASIAVLTPGWQPRIALAVTGIQEEAETGQRVVVMELRSSDIVAFDHVRQF